MSEALSPHPSPGPGELLTAVVKLLSHLDAVVFEQTRLNRYISEDAYQPMSASNVLTRQSTNAVRITSVIVACPTKPTTLLLGALRIPFPAGTTPLPGLSYVLRGQMPVRLDTQDGQPAESTLILMGEEYPITSYSSGGFGG